MPTSCTHTLPLCIHKQLITINLKWADKPAALPDKTLYSLLQHDDQVLIIVHIKK